MPIQAELKKPNFYVPIDLDFKLYLITDRHQIEEKPFMAAMEDALKGGVKAIQLREKDLGTREYLQLAYQLRTLTLKFDARLFINDRVDIAVAVEADGVQLGQKSMPAFAVRKLAPGLIIGVSTHSINEALKAESEGADFITFGPVYQTASKSKFGHPLGLDMLSKAVSSVRIPVFAIGGIKMENVAETIHTRAEGIALISGILAAKNIKSSAMKFLKQLK